MTQVFFPKLQKKTDKKTPQNRITEKKPHKNMQNPLFISAIG